jgi:hypothetical protein
MSLQAETWLRIIDRELLVSGFCHDVRGPLTALQGFAELENLEDSSTCNLAIARLGELLRALPFQGRRTRRADLSSAFAVPSTPVWVDHGFAPLLSALDGLDHGPPHVVLVGDLAELVVPDLPVDEVRAEWTTFAVRRWDEHGGPGLRGARLRIAARLAGARHTTTVAPEDVARGVLRIAFVRAPE